MEYTLRLKLFSIDVMILMVTLCITSPSYNVTGADISNFYNQTATRPHLSCLCIIVFSFSPVPAAEISYIRGYPRPRFRNRTGDRRSVIFLSLYAGISRSSLLALSALLPRPGSPSSSSSCTVTVRTGRTRPSILIERRKTTTTSWKPQQKTVRGS